MLSMEPKKITDIVITNPIKEGEEIDDKKMILDVKVEVNLTQIINLEMQELKDNLQHLQEENTKFQEESVRFQKESAKFQEESIKKDERIRFLEEQLAKSTYLQSI